MALNKNALTTLSTIKRELGLNNSSHDSYLEQLINQASAMFEKGVGRKLYYDKHHKVRASQPSGSSTLIIYGAIPVIKINSIKINDRTVDEDNYFIEEPDLGFIGHTSGSWPGTETSSPAAINRYPRQPGYIYEVDYEGGYITPQQAMEEGLERTLPYDIEAAIVNAVVTGFMQRGVDQSVLSVKVGNATTSWGSGSTYGGSLSRMFISLTGIINHYKTVITL